MPLPDIAYRSNVIICRKDHKMALIQLKDVETAIEGMILMHNFKLAENAHLRVSFSKSGI